jgi:hypothetical protein
MCYVAPPARENKPTILIDIELEDECLHVKKVSPHVQMFSIITTIFSLITSVDIFVFRSAIYKRDWLQ